MVSVVSEDTPIPALRLVVDVVELTTVDSDEVAVPVIFVVVLARLSMPAK